MSHFSKIKWSNVHLSNLHTHSWNHRFLSLHSPSRSSFWPLCLCQYLHLSQVTQAQIFKDLFESLFLITASIHLSRYVDPKCSVSLTSVCINQVQVLIASPLDCLKPSWLPFHLLCLPALMYPLDFSLLNFNSFTLTHHFNLSVSFKILILSSTTYYLSLTVTPTLLSKSLSK